MKVRDLIRQLQQLDGDLEVVVGLPTFEEDGEDGDFEVVPVLPDVSQDAIETDTGEQLVAVIFADPPEDDEEYDDAANDNET